MIAESLLPLVVPIDQLQYLDPNPRRGDIAAVARSLERFGQRKPIVANRAGVVSAGNHTLAAARELGWTEIAVVRTDDDDVTAKAWALADNRTSDLGSYDNEILASLIAEVQAFDAELLSAASYSSDDLDVLLAQLAPPEPVAPSSGHVFSDDQILDAAFVYFREHGFPFPVVPLHEAMQQLNALASTESTELLGTLAAYHVADPYQLHRFETPVIGTSTPLQTFAIDDRLRHAIKLAAETGKVSHASVRAALGFTRGAQLAAQFRPGVALSLMRRFAPRNGTVLDTSTGWGGRLVGFIASECKRYIGIDPAPRTCAGNRALVSDLCPSSKSVEIVESPAEDVARDAFARQCDFALTSPPYFSKERYAEDDTQSWVRYSTAEMWRDSFLAPMFALQHASLKAGSHSVVNIADVTIGSQDVPLVAWAIECAQQAGFEHVRTERMPLGRVPGEGERLERFEPLLVLRKRESTRKRRS